MRISSKPIMETFALKTDPEGIAKVTIAQATFGSSRRIAETTSKQIHRWNDQAVGVMEMERNFNFRDEQALKIFETLTGTEGMVDDDTNQPWFNFTPVDGVMRPADRDQFNIQLNKLPDLTIDEIYGYVLKMNPQWDPAAKDALGKGESKATVTA
jgi:hypothetical protein